MSINTWLTPDCLVYWCLRWTYTSNFRNIFSVQLSKPLRGLLNDWQVSSPSSRWGSDTLWEGLKDNCDRCLSGVFFHPLLSYAQKPHCLLHDVLPQTFIGPPMTATFHIRILLTRGISFCVCCDPRTWFCIHCMISKLAHSSSYLVFQAVPVQRKLNFWQVFLMRCRQTWFTPSQIQHLPESMLFFHDLILPNIISCSHQISKSETSSVEKLPCSKTPINWFWNMSYIKYIRNTVICCRVKQKPLVPIQRVLGPLWSWFNLNSYVRQNIYP